MLLACINYLRWRIVAVLFNKRAKHIYEASIFSLHCTSLLGYTGLSLGNKFKELAGCVNISVTSGDKVALQLESFHFQQNEYVYLI